MKKIRDLIILFLIATVVSCSPVYDVQTVYGTTTPFPKLETYIWLPPPNDLQIDPAIDEQIRNAVDAQLKAKGLRTSRQDPDVFVVYNIKRQQPVDVTDFGYDSYSGRYVGAPTRWIVQEATLILEVIDTRSKKLLWRGSAQDVIATDGMTQNSEELINDTVKKILQNFPPGTAK